MRTSRVGEQMAPARLLEFALVFTLVAHAAGMALMLPCLLPGLPGGVNADVGARAAWVAGHPWVWRLGWSAWQVTAVSDLLLCAALLCTRWVPKVPAAAALVCTLAAVVPDQSAQFSWTWRGVELAQEVVSDGVGRYAAYEAEVFFKTAGLGAAGYVVAALFWTWCFAGARGAGIGWTRGLTRLSAATWGVFALSTGVVFLPAAQRSLRGVEVAVGLGNALAFVLLMVWLVWVSELVFRRARPVLGVMRGSASAWRHPGGGIVARGVELLANSRVARAVGVMLPSFGMSSDVEDVVYMNWLVEADRLETLVERGLRLRRLGPGGRYAVFSILTFRHGHFGPTFFGPLRRVWPSPVQSNWRVHVENPRTGVRGIQFLTTAITSTPHALATRLLAEGVPMHVPAAARVEREGRAVSVTIEPGRGSAPDVRASLVPSAEPEMTGRWKVCFATWGEMLAYIVPQDRAMCVAWRGGQRWVVRQEIELGIPLSSCVPMSGSVESAAAGAVVGEAGGALCFVVERVAFSFTREGWDG